MFLIEKGFYNNSFLVNDPLTTSRVFRYEFHNGNTYEGEWMDAKMNGNGIMTLANKNVYEGDFKNGKHKIL